MNFICVVCKKRLANRIYCDESGHWHSMCAECFRDKTISKELRGILELIKELREERAKDLIEKLGEEK